MSGSALFRQQQSNRMRSHQAPVSQSARQAFLQSPDLTIASSSMGQSHHIKTWRKPCGSDEAGSYRVMLLARLRVDNKTERPRSVWGPARSRSTAPGTPEIFTVTDFMVVMNGTNALVISNIASSWGY
jgi:hypothetical protein